MTKKKVAPKKADAKTRVSQGPKLKGELTIKDIRLTDKQIDLIKTIRDKNTNVVFISGPAGTAKAQPMDAKIVTPSGITNMGDINVGDLVISKNGRPTTVLGVFEQGTRSIVEVFFSDGSSTECCHDHLWYTETYNDRNARTRKNGTRVGRRRVGSVKTIDTIANELYVQGGKLNHGIPICNPIEFEGSELPIDPYLLGCLIGDGGLTQNIIFSTIDVEIIRKLKGCLPKNHSIVKRINNDCAYGIVSDNPSPGSNIIRNCIRDLKLNVKSEHKFIPDSYRFASIEDRVALIQGLMDTDGTISRSKRNTSSHESYTTVSEQLSLDFKFLVESLGGTCKLRKSPSSYINESGDRISCLDHYTCHICFNPGINPFSLTRKAELYIPKTKYKPRRFITHIEQRGEKECRCISVEDSSHLYLTDHCIVTHNTYTSILGGIHLFNDKKISNMLYIRSAVECSEEKLGFLPGELNDKMEPYIQPMVEKLEELLFVKDAQMLRNSGMVSGMPINYLRGLNWNAKFIIADESQNLTMKELTTLITRVGKYSTLVICGDPYQVDIKNSGFTELVEFFSDDADKEQGMYSYELTDDDILRGEFCKYVVKKLKTLKSYKK
jgi:hypothetical protein